MTRKVSGIIIALLSLLWVGPWVGLGFYIDHLENELHASQQENTQLNQDLASANEQNEALNLQLGQDATTIGKQKEDLEKANGEISYWQSRTEFREFESCNELTAWLEQDDCDRVFYFYLKGAGPQNYDCDDYAEALMRHAVEDGFYMSKQIEGDHMLNNTAIGNDIYFIEPQEDKVWLWGCRD